MIVVAKDHGAFVFNAGNVNIRKQIVVYKMGGELWTCDVHDDNDRVVCGGSHALEMWKISTGMKVRALVQLNERTKSNKLVVKYVKFLCGLEQVLYVDGSSHIHAIDMQGSFIRTLDSHVSAKSPTLEFFNENTRLITSESDTTFRIHDLRTGNVLYAFVDRGSDGFLSFAVHPTGRMILARNRNKLLYRLEISKDDQYHKMVAEQWLKRNHISHEMSERSQTFTALKQFWKDN